jgi:hypothetical protein
MAKENKKDDSQNLPAGVSEFIKQVIKKMGYRRKVRLDVQAELETHFVDELKDCTTDEEREQKARRLLTDFGDVKLLAVLLRRAKKRCRPLWRTVVVRSFQALGVLILCFIVYTVWLLSGKPVIKTNYIAEFNKMVRPAADESQNAAPLYNEAAGLYEQVSDDFILYFAKNHKDIDEKNPMKVHWLIEDINEYFPKRDDPRFAEDIKKIRKDVLDVLSGLLRKDFDEFTVEQKSIINRWLREKENAMELVIEGSKRPHYWRVYSNDKEDNGMIGILIPQLTIFRDLARCLRWRALLSAEQGGYESSFADLQSCYCFGCNIRGDKTLIEQLVGIAIEALSVGTVRDILGDYKIDSTILAECQRGFEKISIDENYAISFNAEKLTIYDEIQRCFTSDCLGGGHLYLPRFRQIHVMQRSRQHGDGFEYDILDFCIAAPLAFVQPNKEETLASTNEYFDYLEKLSHKSFAQNHSKEQNIEDKIHEIIRGNMFLSNLIPAGRRIIEIGNRIPTEVGATLAMIAITRYKQDKGVYPQDLKELVAAGYLSRLPIDSFSDKPLVYRRTDGDFILYSYGENCRDDGGVYGTDGHGRYLKWGGDGDRVFWPPRQE